MSGMYAAYHGPDGIREIAMNAFNYAHAMAALLIKGGYTLAHDSFFDTIRVLNVNAGEIREKAEAANINFYYPDDRTVQISFDELSDCAEAAKIAGIFGVDAECARGTEYPVPMKRESAILAESIFNKYHSETEMMRYIKKLERKDISLTHSMIPLGSCTMKLNAAAEMLPLSWSELTDVHPFAPAWQTEGYNQILSELEHDLCTITGFERCSLQPNSGAAGEYAGLMTIRRYHEAQGQGARNTMIIPTSAHGTNPASAAHGRFQDRIGRLRRTRQHQCGLNCGRRLKPTRRLSQES